MSDLGSGHKKPNVGLSREAKLLWATRGGHTIHNLQHDGVVISLRVVSPLTYSSSKGP